MPVNDITEFDDPVFVDNRDGNTLSNALNEYLENWYEDYVDPPSISIVTGYFNPEGFYSIADKLDDVDQLRLLLGTEPNRPDQKEIPSPDEPSGEQYKRQKIEEGLKELKSAIETDRNLIGFTREQNEKLSNMVDFFKRDDVEVRLYKEGFVHGKAFIFSKPDSPEGVISGSSNFTAGGLNSNLELNLGRYDPFVRNAVMDWFDELWSQAEEFNLADIYESRMEEYSPHLIFLRALWEHYKEDIREEEEQKDGLELTTFQNDGVFRANRFLNKRNGVIIADGVGLGKTFIAGELLRQTVNDNRQNALVIAPASLKDGMWKKFRSDIKVQFDLISFAGLRSAKQLGGDKEGVLNADKDKYQLVVIDEAHAFRNPGTDQSDTLRNLLKGDPPKDLVLLTATPVNNSLWDLYYLLRYFVQHDAEFADLGIPSLREHFQRAENTDPNQLSPDLLFDVLDETTVRRTRQFVKNNYEGDRIDTDDGVIHIKFPDPKAVRVDYNFHDTFDGSFFESVAGGLGGTDDPDQELTLARYTPSGYIQNEAFDGSELALAGLLRSGLLKRFESSRSAFINTLERMRDQNQVALELVQEGVLPEPEAIDEWMESDNEQSMDEALEDAETRDIESGNFQIDEYCEDVQADIDLMTDWIQQARNVHLQDDGKLYELKETLKEIANRAEEEPLEEEGDKKRNFRKVLIFTYFEDTLNWILDYLEEIVETEEKLSVYKNRIAGVSGSDSVRGISRKEAVQGFAPDSTDAPAGVEDKFDILVSTDVLSQGVNLQQCRNVINYDLPWNPMRVVQRNGRIDRIGSEHDTVYNYTFFAGEQLDEFLELERRIKKKLKQAASTIGVENEVIPGVTEDIDQNFADRKEDIEKLREEDEEIIESGGSQAAAFSSEEFRQQLRTGLKQREDDIKNLPWGSGAALKGKQNGYFFTARVGEREFFRFVPANSDTEEIIDEILPCLKTIVCEPDTESYMEQINDSLKDGVYDAWQDAKDHIFQEWQRKRDPQAFEPRIPKLCREIAEHIREYPPKNLNQEEIEAAIDSIETPIGKRYVRELRELWREDIGPVAKTQRVLDKIEEFGLQPYEFPEEYPPIEKDQIKLVCWMIVSE